MSTLKKVSDHNRKAASEFRKYIRLIPKTIAIYAADAAIAGVMRPADKNFPLGPNGEATVTGKLMPHNSSNAAWNWRVTFSGEEAPLYAKGKGHIGEAFEYRSDDFFRDAEATVAERRISDINKKLYNKLFSSPNAKFPKFTIYNNIDRLNISNYVDRSNVSAAANELVSYSMTGSHMGYVIAKNFMRSGKFGMPDVTALLASLKSSQSSHFMK